VTSKILRLRRRLENTASGTGSRFVGRSASNTTGTTRPKRMRWSGHEACMRERTDAYRFLVGKPAGEDGRIILKWAVKKQDGTGFMPVRIGTSGGVL